MKLSRRDCFVFLLSFLGSTCCVENTQADRTKQLPLLTGVSLAGPEFGTHLPEFSNEQPGELGKDYVFPRPQTVKYFADAGIRLIRLPLTWERIQPRLGGELDPAYLAEAKKVLRAAQEHNAIVIIDLHNYGRYRLSENGTAREYVIDQEVAGRRPVSQTHFADLWKRLTIELRSERAVAGYGLMNEPHDMGKSNWKEISQRAVDAIRKIDRHTAIVVSGDDWSSAERFSKANGDKPWIRDPANHIVYEAHCYFDKDGSGKYRQSFAAEAKADPEIANRGVKRAQPFLDWCQRNAVRGLIGEFGTPADQSWREVTQRFLKSCNQAQVGVCYWAAGEWWGDYLLSIQPNEDSKSIAPQLRWLQDVNRASKKPTR